VSTPRFLADEDLRRSIVLATRRLEPTLEFVTVQDLGLSGIDDPAVLDFAQANGWLVVSHDVNTMRAAAEARLAAGLAMRGLFLVPQTRPTRVIAESLVLIWSASPAEDWQSRIVYLPL
jgi:Domain of unknown function (DUF5615)